jgi:hypothetical protein
LTVESNTAGLLEVLAVNYGLVTSIVRSASEREARERAQPDSAPLISALGQVVDLLIKVPAEAATAQAGDTQQAALLLALFDEIHGIYRRALGAPNQARLAAEGVMAGVWSWSTGLKNDPEGAFAARVKRAIDHALTTA